jgi:hypothetical protein
MIRIWVDTAEPPTGRVVIAQGRTSRPFSGWLDLLGILADAMSVDAMSVDAVDPDPGDAGPRGNDPQGQA